MGSSFSSGVSRTNLKSNGIHWQGNVRTPSGTNNRSQGIEWQRHIRYYSYASTGNLDLDISDLQKHINQDRFEMLYLYKTPLSEFQWTNTIFFHVYVIFYTNTPEGGFWWSLEKTGESLILQMSRDIEDVKDRLEGGRRVSEGSSWYWEPQFIIRDSSWETFETLYKFIIVDKDQLNIRYNFAEENCKNFAKIVFDRIATNKNWNYII